jgi:phenylalanine-4-hydroxylase
MKAPVFTAADDRTWSQLFAGQERARGTQVHSRFAEGLAHLEVPADRVPDLEAVNRRLRKLTGFSGVWVEGHEAADSFFPMLARREFPIGAFIRDPKDLGYTPAPDVFHDLYGHLPFLAYRPYADFCQAVGEAAAPYASKPEVIKEFETYFWFSVEFSMIETPVGIRIYGAGLASSTAECDFAMGLTEVKPAVLPFDVEKIRRQPYRIDVFQEILFLLESEAQLFESLHQLKRGIR